MTALENKLKNWWTTLNPNGKLAFFSTLLLGFLVHMFVFTNQIINHDSLFNFYATQDMYTSGRCFLKYACIISSYFDVHWVNGVLSIFYLALCSSLLVCIFRLKSTIFTVLTSLFLVAFPVVTSIFSYTYAADGYFLAMLCSLFAAYLMIAYNNSWKLMPLCILLYAFSLGTYQAFVSVGFVVLLLWYLVGFLTNQFHDTKALLLHIFRSFLTALFGIAVYYVCFKFTLFIHNSALSDYQGISSSGLSFSNPYELLSIIKRCIAETITFFSGQEMGIRISIFNYIVYFFIFLFAGYLFLKNKVYKNLLHVGCILLILILIPCACYIYYFISDTVSYHMLMKMSLGILFLSGFFLAEHIPFSTLKAQMGCLIFLISFLLLSGRYAVDDNLAYLALHQSYEKSYSFATRIADRIEQLDEYQAADTISLAVIGNPPAVTYKDIMLEQTLPPMTGVTSGLVFFEQYHYVSFLTTYMGIPCTSATEEQLTSIINTEEYQTMGIWPDSNSVKTIEDTVVIRFE